MLNGKPLRCVTPEMFAAAMPKVKEELANFETAEDMGPEKSPFCYAYCCTKMGTLAPPPMQSEDVADEVFKGDDESEKVP